MRAPYEERTGEAARCPGSHRAHREIAARGREAFARDELIQNWMVSHITMIGEACRALPDEFQARYVEVSWADIIAMRNILVHHYFGIDLDAVWSVVEQDIPELKVNIQTILNKLED